MSDQSSPFASSKNGLLFNEVAALYDAIRPGYPEALVGDIVSFAGLTAGARVLEIGCGTGQATISFASRGLQMVCLEPGPDLARFAQKNLAAYEKVRVVCESFESWQLEPEPFDLVFSANAIQWVQPAVRFTKTAQALRPGGVLALFRNIALRSKSPPHNSIQLLKPKEPRRWPRENELRRSMPFRSAKKLRYTWEQQYDAASYVNLLRTLYPYCSWPDSQRKSIFDTARKTIEIHGGNITVPYVTQLLMARVNEKLSYWNRLINGRLQWQQMLDAKVSIYLGRSTRGR
jgi:SAM-dependent methyltransferase